MNKLNEKLLEKKILRSVILSSIACVIIAMIAGFISSLHYIESISFFLQNKGFSFANFRPLHTVFISAWLFLGSTVCVFKFLFDQYGIFKSYEKKMFKIQMLSFAFAGLGILFSVLLGHVSGREYLGFNPIFSIFIIFGWFIFAYLFFKKILLNFWNSPVYVYMWASGILYFIIAFIEAHFYLLSFLKNNPIIDLQIQWKSCGSLVGAFNQIIHGGLLYLLERIGQDKKIAHSKWAFSLFGISLLNSFTNFAHHTYHLPQSNLIKWISFIVSMLEIIILSKIFIQAVNRSSIKNKSCLIISDYFLSMARKWNLILLPLALLISIPPLNTLIHGTTVVMAHAMGSEIVIDSYILLGIFSFLLNDVFLKNKQKKMLNNRLMYNLILLMNLCIAILLLWLVIAGLVSGINRYLCQEQALFINIYQPFFIVVFGGLFAFFLILLFYLWLPLFFK